MTTVQPRLCLNMIVKNELANLHRCLKSVSDYVSCWIIGDTGSTDGTQDLIRAFFAERGIPGELHSFPFHDFEQARNEALTRAYATSLEYDYLLLADADMELVVENPDFRAGLTAPGYRLIQRSALTYWNIRLVRRDAGARYVGVTHEYLDVPGGAEELHGVWYKDHATGANRVDKFERDIRLLSAALEKEPENPRYWFYLAQSQRDAGHHSEAAASYARRTEMGGWDEEAWYAKLQQARCLLSLQDEGGFLREALAAFNQRPRRAEPLYELARFYRSRGMNDTSVLFCEAGMSIPRPTGDVLFIEDFVYETGLLEEYSIVANYASNTARRERGHAACEYLVLCRDTPSGSRDLARANLRFYMHKAGNILPSLLVQPVGFEPPAGYHATNPSVARDGDRLVLVQRTVNYVLTKDNRYETAEDAAIHTRNFLLEIDEQLITVSSTEILMPSDLPVLTGSGVKGLEDLRLFQWRDELWCTATVRELTEAEWCQQLLAGLVRNGTGPCTLVDWRLLSQPGRHEKNWMPQVDGDDLRFIYSCDPVRTLDPYGQPLSESTPPFTADWFRGGSQMLPFDGGWLALIHEVWATADQRFYSHRFIWLDRANTLKLVSDRFYFQEKGVEFAAGMAWHPNGQALVLSFGVADNQSWLATVDPHDVRRLLYSVDETLERAHGRIPPRLASDQAGAASAKQTALPSATSPQRKSAGTTAVAPNPRDADHMDNTKPDQVISNSVEAFYYELAPFLRAVDVPAERRLRSREHDDRISQYLSTADISTLPVIHCFYEVLTDNPEHHSLVAAIASMTAAGHRTRVWSYTPAKLSFLTKHGAELCDAADVVPRAFFQQVLAKTEVRYFSDIFRYAVLYEYGGLWMDGDVVLLRPFPFHGDHFFNLQWRGAHVGHFVCGNVIYAKPFSRHMRLLYEMAVEHFRSPRDWGFGDIGPKLLTDYIASPAGAELKEKVFSPMLFNSIDWTEIDRFTQPLSALADYLNDDRVFGVHLWNNRTQQNAHEANQSLLSLLSDPLTNFPRFEHLADQFNTDKNRVTGNRHFYARVYERLFAPLRLSVTSLIEIGLCRGLAERNQTEVPSVVLWLRYFPFCQVTGIDLTDFSSFNDARFKSFVCDQSQLNEIRAVAAQIEPNSVDIIIDDGSHASYDQQLTFRELFPLLRPGGLYFIEDLDWQPAGEVPGVALTKQIFRELWLEKAIVSSDPLNVSALSHQISEILFFDSQMELERKGLLGGLVAIRKTGGPGHMR